MRQVLDAKVRDAAVTADLVDGSRSIRVTPNNYFTGLMLGLFFSALLIYLEFDWSAGILTFLTLAVIPALLWFDRIVFDGKRLSRTGIIPRAWAWFNGYYYRLRINDIEQVETQALRTMKRGGKVFYRYRTSFSGRGLKFVVCSGGEDFRRVLGVILPRLGDDVLDNRSIELRDYLNEPKEVLMKAEFMHIPSAEVLEDSLDLFKKHDKRRNFGVVGPAELERVEYLRRLANELRLSGHLLQALEAFRRALLIHPKNAWLLFEAARCLHSFAGSEQDGRLQRRSLALMRLSERRANGDNELLARLGESYFQFGDWERARKVFLHSVEKVEENFRSLRGMAEIALREGKLAHVIHNFSSANRLAGTPALRRWTKNESDYFSRLNEDEDYLEMEIGRVNLLETLENSKRTALKVAIFGVPAILVGITLGEELIANVGWAISAVALLIWTGLTVSVSVFQERIPYELIEED